MAINVYVGEVMSLLSWERGLKLNTNVRYSKVSVAPLVGAWIEIVLAKALI